MAWTEFPTASQPDEKIPDGGVLMGSIHSGTARKIAVLVSELRTEWERRWAVRTTASLARLDPLIAGLEVAAAVRNPPVGRVLRAVDVLRKAMDRAEGQPSGLFLDGEFGVLEQLGEPHTIWDSWRPASEKVSA